jgi:hypothetical protein
MAYNWTTEWPGVYARHSSDCPLRNGGECTCRHVGYRASGKAPDNHSRILSPEFESAVQARDWLRDQRARVTAATAVADEGPAVSTVINDFLAAATRGEIRDSAGAGFTGERVRHMRDGLYYIEAELGSARIQTVRRRQVQALVDQLYAVGLPSDRVMRVVETLRELFIYAVQRDLVDFNPIVQLRLQAEDSRLPQAVLNGNGNGNGNGFRSPGAVGDLTAPYTPTFATAAAEPPKQWTPGAFAAVDDEPLEDDAIYGPGGQVFDEDWAPRMSSEMPPPMAQQTPPPMAQQTPPPTYEQPPAPVYQQTPYEQTPPPVYQQTPPPMHEEAPPPVYQQTPPPMPAQMPTQMSPQMPPRAPWVPQESAGGDPYGPATAFAPQAMPMTMPVPAPFAAETRYGTPTYGTDAVTANGPILPEGDRDNAMLSEQMFWWVTRIVVIVFVLIALILAAESI